jgi:hypothetical protein
VTDTQSVDDRRAEFLILVGDVCLAAISAQLVVELGLRDGRDVTGVPTRVTPTSGQDEFDSTGYTRTVSINDHEVALPEVIRCAITDR